MTTVVTGGGAGALVREWRQRRRLSQMDLALEAGVSTRHLSFVETGRSKPSPELLLALADRLQVPLREQNSLLLAAGYAPRYQQTRLDDPAMSPARAALERLLGLHDPYPGVVIDHSWNVVMANEAASCLAAALPPPLAGPPMNVFRACLHPDGLARSTLNFPEWATYLLGQLNRLKLLTAGPDVAALADEVSRYPNVTALRTRPPARHWPEEPALLVPWNVELNGTELSLFTTLTSFGTPRDITLAELAVELFYPADDKTADVLRGWQAQPAGISGEP
ncbi:MAG TPA: helix-turn-helix transcriptional regulator [Streptosporangiaceae bacterium]|jgi:transcriptional regulator with XRE-family HTH domain|nr:helix-turn-helix transcriptional regulator [Streptosporangiaceae bacterium]